LAKPQLVGAKQTWVVFCTAGCTDSRTCRTLATNPQNHLFLTSYTLGLISVCYVEGCVSNSWTENSFSTEYFLLIPCS